MANTSILAAFERMWQHVVAALGNKSDISHNHNDLYYTDEEVDTKLASKADKTHNHDADYDAKGSASAVQENLNAVGDTIDAHIDNADIHVTTTNKSNWNTAYTHSQATHARTDATKVADSSTNGNILINGTETNVYTHPNSGVTAGTYKSVTVNAQGHITGGSNPTTLSGYGITDAESKGAASAALASAKEYTDTVASGKSDSGHNHDSDYDTKGAASSALASAKEYADSAATTAANKVKNDLLNGAGAAYDTLKELGDLIVDNQDAIDALETVAAGKADKTHGHAIADVSGLQTALDGKAASSHGTHVSFDSTNKPKMDGTAAFGTSSKVARADHVHPTDTSRAAKTDLDSHTSNTTVHVTSTERSNWNAAKSHADSAHAPSNAEKNQNAFSNVTVGSTTIAADSTTDTLTLVAGTNVTITPDATNDKITISATDTNTTYSAGTGISLSGTTFSNSGVRSISTGSANGTISVNTNGTSADVAVKGLGSAAYKATSAFDAAGAANTALTNAKTYTDTVAEGKANTSHSHAISDVSGLQTALDGKAASSHGTHVSFSSTAPVMDGTASVGSASTVARSDHKHPTDTSRASKTEFNTHTGNTTVHITSTERTNWNAAKTHADSAHAPSNAQANQNAFSNIKVGSTTIAADTTTDTLELVGSNVTITPDATNDKVTFSVANGSTSAKGVVQLTNSTSSTSTTTAATPSSVKSAYDLANTAKTNAATAQTRADSAYTLAEGWFEDIVALQANDSKVEQIHTAANGNFRLLLTPSFQSETTTAYSYFNKDIYVNPYYKTIYADIEGTATNVRDITAGNFLVGNGTEAMVEKTPAEVLAAIGFTASTGNATRNSNNVDSSGFFLCGWGKFGSIVIMEFNVKLNDNANKTWANYQIATGFPKPNALLNNVTGASAHGILGTATVHSDGTTCYFTIDQNGALVVSANSTSLANKHLVGSLMYFTD